MFVNLAVIQFAPLLGHPGDTRTRVQQLLHQCEGADLVVLPELANSGYAFNSREQALSMSEDPLHSPFVDLLTAHCESTGAHVVTGFCERANDALYNSALLVGPGGVLGTYRKLHLFLNEKDFFRPGDLGLPTFDVCGLRLGMLICFDWRFPETWRALALAGAQLICHPSNLITPGLCQRVVPVHALLNRVHVATANRVGTEGTLTFTGLSQIVDASGHVVAQALAEEEIVLSAQLDPGQARDKTVNDRNDLFADRRPEQYSVDRA